MGAPLLVILAVFFSGCAKIEELWARIDPLSRPEPPPVTAEENPRTPPPAMPAPPPMNSKTSSQGDRPADDRIMSLGLSAAAPPAEDGVRRLWEPAPGATGRTGPQPGERPSRGRRARPKDKAAPSAR